jgi:hypothetical protein
MERSVKCEITQCFFDLDFQHERSVLPHPSFKYIDNQQKQEGHPGHYKD